MVAIKPTLAALPFLLAAASTVAAQRFTYNDDLAVRADFAGNHGLLDTRDEDTMLAERGSSSSKHNGKGKRNIYRRGAGQSRPVTTKSGKKISGPKHLEEDKSVKTKSGKAISGPTEVKGNSVYTMGDKALGNSEVVKIGLDPKIAKEQKQKGGRPVSSASRVVDIGLDPAIAKDQARKKGRRGIYRRGSGNSKHSKKEKQQDPCTTKSGKAISGPTEVKGNSVYTMGDKALGNSEVVKIGLDPAIAKEQARKKGRRSIYRRGFGKSSSSKQPKPVTTKSGKKISGPKHLEKEKPVTTKSGKAISGPTEVKGTHPMFIGDNTLKPSSQQRPPSTTSSNGDPFHLDKYRLSTTSSNGDPFYLDKGKGKGKRNFDFDYYFA